MTDPDLTAKEWALISGTALPPPSPPTPLSLVSAGDFNALFTLPETQSLLTAGDTEYLHRTLDYPGYLQQCLSARPDTPPHTLLAIGIAALWSFIQANVTGPPLPFTPAALLLPPNTTTDAAFATRLEKATVTALTVDGETAYHLMPHALLLSLSKTLLNAPAATHGVATAPWWRLRVNFWHQRVLSEATAGLHDVIYEDAKAVAVLAEAQSGAVQARFLVERALVDTYFGHDTKALRGLEEAAERTGMVYALTGVMGKRTKFQQTDTSQLVVLARSKEEEEEGSGEEDKKAEESAPKALKLDDDTLLEAIAFTPKSTAVVEDAQGLPKELQELDPNDQPKLQPLDAAILLLVAETIKNTNPAEGLTREEMMPYAERVLKHSTNWEVYTLGLLVRSKMEGYRSRTVERGLLQLQAVVDQVIADTTQSTDSTTTTNTTTTFLPRAKEDEAAPVRDRLLYIHQLTVPTRWDLEAELASRWISMGGLRTALEIYERLQMWPEVALCWAATEKEEKARKVIHAQLFHPDTTTDEISPPPANAPRLWCILGDIDNNPSHYERAWEISGGRYARAKRSLARHYFSAKEYRKSADAYAASLHANPLNHASWFALGCCHLEMEDWDAAVEAFTRTVSIDETDAEAWSNLASALLHRTTQLPAQPEWHAGDGDDDNEAQRQDQADFELVQKENNKRNALAALKRASTSKYDSWRIWENLLIIAASVVPPSWTDVVVAMRRIIDLRKDSAGESCVDVDVLEMLVRHVVTSEQDASKPGLAKMVVELVEKEVTPLITHQERLWRIVGKVALWRGRPRDALEAEEKAWRAVQARPGVTDSTEGAWDGLVDATVELVGAYESLGGMERTEGLGAGEPVARDWRFKARSAVRGVMGRGKESWEDSRGWERLKEALEGLKN
ncbi:uncharacterized protein LAJ45_06951 [Morchella importuna]|uniref:uncharacterized protein n=1 Tax=Morchella importuna TaxID=1174673 RepID=UPI001E8E1125|nr:uncharacterized protein LAJ45_06951 [Morchella importuna]KAH8148976.1 hypothetical protein LAJ45_06951 [Morchella importuna]